MRQNGDAAVSASEPSQVEKIAVRKLKTFMFEAELTGASKKGAEDGLDMAIPKNGRWPEFTLDDGHGNRSHPQMD
jgi:hypothetical protein